MSTPEGRVKQKIKKYLDAKGVWYFMPMMLGYGRKGVPDIIGCYNGCFFAIEVKAPGKADNLTPWQLDELKKIVLAGGDIVVADKVEDVYAIFAET